MIKEKIKFDDFHEYEVANVKEGGMGRVLILNRVSGTGTSTEPFLEALMKNNPRLADKYSLIYREKVAAKTFKDNAFVQRNKALFERELNIWINIDVINTAKLLKIVFIQDRLYALMPFYNGNLREEIEQGRFAISEAKFILINVIRGLCETFEKHGIVHQDLKPENILIDFEKDHTRFFVSDWGIANLQRRYCPDVLLKDSLPSFVDTMTGLGTLPYMSPERFIDYSTHMTADVFSLGMIFFELLLGHLPYDFSPGKPLISQIIDHDYFYIADHLLQRHNLDEKIRSVILKCIHPDMSKRYTDYENLVFDIYKC
ncbi:MAG: protein kinase [Nitrospirota bacterium]